MTGSSIVLVVDDEADIRESLCAHLERSGFAAASAASAAEARDWLSSHKADLVLLDIMMPGEDGLSLCRHLREVDKTPVILLTALADDTDKIVGLEIGADDYVTKPFNPRELVARIRAVIRRAPSLTHSDVRAQKTQHFAGWTFDEEQSEIKSKDGVVVTLSAGEVAILKVFVEHVGEVLSRDDLMQHSRGRDTLAFERTIDNVISRLRKKIEIDPGNPRIIKTVRGGGYRLVSTNSG
ncbi:MAG: response regulator [Pseudomonadota bacterium]